MAENQERQAENLRSDLSEIYAERSEMILDRDAARRIQNYQEILRSGPRDVEELVEAVNAASFRDVRRFEIGQKYGEGIFGRFRAFLAGEFDVGVGRDDEIRRSCWNRCAEVGRRTLMTVFNRRTVAASGAAAALGVLTGGVGAAAAGVVFGSIAGRGVAEAIAAVRGKETGARADILRAEKERWYELKKMAQELSQTQDTEKKAEIIRAMTDLYFREGKSVILEAIETSEDKLVSEREALNKSRARWQLAGEIVGLGSGVAYSFLTGHFAAIDIDLWNKVKGQKIAHEVIRLNNEWCFVYHQSEVAAGLAGEAGKQVIASGAQAVHLLGEPAWKILAATVVERGVPVLMSAWLGVAIGRRIEKGADKREAMGKEYRAKKMKLQKGRLEEKSPKKETPQEKIEKISTKEEITTQKEKKERKKISIPEIETRKAGDSEEEITRKKNQNREKISEYIKLAEIEGDPNEILRRFEIEIGNDNIEVDFTRSVVSQLKKIKEISIGQPDLGNDRVVEIEVFLYGRREDNRVIIDSIVVPAQLASGDTVTVSAPMNKEGERTFYGTYHTHPYNEETWGFLSTQDISSGFGKTRDGKLVSIFPDTMIFEIVEPRYGDWAIYPYNPEERKQLLRKYAVSGGIYPIKELKKGKEI